MGTTAAIVLALMLVQYGRPIQPRQRGPVNPQAQSTDAVATFGGTFKSADKKYLFIETDDGNTLKMFVTGATKFVRDGKTVKPAEFESGEDVTVEANYDPHLNLIADRVVLGKPPKPDAKTDKPAEEH